MSDTSPPWPDGDLIERRGFWARYSPHGEFPWSSAMSCTLLAFLSVLLLVVAAPFLRGDPTPPAVDVLVVGPDESAPAGDVDDLAAMAALEGTLPDEPLEAMPDLPVEDLSEVTKPELRSKIEPAETGKELDEAAETAQSTLDRLAAARQQLDANLNQGASQGTGTGGGGTGAAGRGARVARWVLHFNTRSAKHYMAQLDGLGAVIAFPLTGNRWRYYFDISSDRRRSEIRDLSDENRLYWVDEKPHSIAGVAQELGIPASPFMIVFLPVTLEERMLAMELAYRNLREDEIQRTDFEVVETGARYDVRVLRQIPR
jgi:hypothetical protein